MIIDWLCPRHVRCAARCSRELPGGALETPFFSVPAGKGDFRVLGKVTRVLKKGSEMMGTMFEENEGG
jgi:hypothetical protein